MPRSSHRLVRMVLPLALITAALFPVQSGCASKVCPASEDPLTVCNNDCARYADALGACCASAEDRLGCEAAVATLSESCPSTGPSKLGETDDSWGTVMGWATDRSCIPEADADEYDDAGSGSDPDDEAVAALAGRLCQACFGGAI